jgi:replicative DNA helicase
MEETSKIPPQDIEIETAVLGALLLEPDSLVKVSDTLHDAVFFKDAHKLIYKAISELFSKDEAVDILTVTNKLKQNGNLDVVGGPYYITTLTNRVASSANIEYHARILEEKYINRQLITIGDFLMKEGYDDSDALMNLDKAQNMISDILTKKSDSIKDMKQLTNDLMEHISEVIKRDGKLIGIPTGLKMFDESLGGLQNGDLVVVAGESSNGKTALALNIAFNASGFGYRVGVWSLEMRSLELTIRAYSNATGINQSRMALHPLNETEINRISKMSDDVNKRALYVDDDAPVDYQRLKVAIKSVVLKKKLDLIVIDYLQLIKHSDFKINKHEMFAEIANDLKRLAKSLNVPVILVSQLSRDRSNPMPSLNRLKGSGDIENAADVVWLTWLPERYGMDTFFSEGRDIPSAGAGHHIIAKARKGKTFDFPVKFNGATTTFSDYKTPEEELTEAAVDDWRERY